MSLIEFQDLHRAYAEGEDILAGVTFSVEPGQVVGLLGKNGAGKTTLLRTALGLLEPQAGSVTVFGLNPRDHSVEVKRRTGYVSEDQILPPFLRVRQVLELHRQVFPDWDDAMASRLVDRFGIPTGKKVRTLSKGQARQVALLCAVAHRPELLLLDEPAGGLDPAARREFLETSIQLLNEEGSTILFSSHYMTDVERLADRIVLLHDGEVLIDNQLDELQESYSLALVPAGSGTTREALEAIDGCLAVRARGDVLRAIFELDPEMAAQALSRANLDGARCTRIALEDMFVELVGGRA